MCGVFFVARGAVPEVPVVRIREDTVVVGTVTKGSYPSSLATMKLATGCGLILTVACEAPAQPSAVSASRVTVAVINPVEALNQVWVGVASLDVVPSPKFHVTLCAMAISGMVNSKGEHTESVLRFNAYSGCCEYVNCSGGNVSTSQGVCSCQGYIKCRVAVNSVEGVVDG